MQVQELHIDKSEELFKESLDLLSGLIATSSFSKEEKLTADLVQKFFKGKEILTQRYLNNVWVKNKYFTESKPTLLLNSHHDTVKPNKGYTLDPFEPLQQDGKLFGLGSNDAGGALVSLMAAFLNFYENKNLNYNIIFIFNKITYKK